MRREKMLIRINFIRRTVKTARRGDKKEFFDTLFFTLKISLELKEILTILKNIQIFLLFCGYEIIENYHLRSEGECRTIVILRDKGS